MQIQFKNISGPHSQAWKNFETLCALIVTREISSAKAIEGKGGDDGIDVLVGAIGTPDHIFQAKYFLDTLTKAQKRQVEKSLEVAIKKLLPKEWTLCIAKDLTPSEERWFEGLKQLYLNVSIDYWNATRLTEKLLKHPDIRFEFFPKNDNFGGFTYLTKSFFSHLETVINTLSETQFYDGARPTWLDILTNQDVRRDITDAVLGELSQDLSGATLIEFVASGGSGKSTFLMRIAYELTLMDRVVLYHQRDCRHIDSREVIRFVTSLGKNAILIVDDAARIQGFDEFLAVLCEYPLSIIIVAATRSFEGRAKQGVFTGSIRTVDIQSTYHWQLDKLTDNEISAFIEKLSSLGKIRQSNRAKLHEIVQS